MMSAIRARYADAAMLPLLRCCCLRYVVVARYVRVERATRGVRRPRVYRRAVMDPHAITITLLPCRCLRAIFFMLFIIAPCRYALFTAMMSMMNATPDVYEAMRALFASCRGAIDMYVLPV